MRGKRAWASPAASRLVTHARAGCSALEGQSRAPSWVGGALARVEGDLGGVHFVGLAGLAGLPQRLAVARARQGAVAAVEVREILGDDVGGIGIDVNAGILEIEPVGGQLGLGRVLGMLDQQ